ncbi:SDR family NAD(P)-dependent oxidoreductase [Antarcticibacterium flavum]|uniref:SDR family NAD(P)-dependent oxidoreductase n=1 Tax=Antarcticibacterium flavum TaxID=2058175 RepID=A0A5B7X3A0_9FLAO|nr:MULTISPECIES: SDR family NAD(P)-dependent oxidoreductase [Antarcticibacterium]MCM4159135.1 NAD(P)-dependent oxidoreductase [Antarcticibacterium sp. W02-3]QCY69535.1 SDR family NAD(P)-dependent oxidoreductase [Antarcticibacterium flavum]
MKTVIITGASSGIGRATALEFAQMGYNLILCGRNEDALTRLQEEFPSAVSSHILIFDVRNKAEVFEQIGNLPNTFSRIDILVNNAGNAHGLEPIQSGNIDDWDAMLDINVKGLLYVTKAVLPGMLERDSGHIINVGSTAGKEVYPNGNVYCASKYAVDALNQGMRLDLNKTGIKVGAVNPGLTKTGFSDVRFKGDHDRAGKVYQGYQPLLPEDIARIIAFMVTVPAHVNIADLTVMPAAQASSVVVNKVEERG